jgi:pyruvate-formate lyase-activating enzyme
MLVADGQGRIHAHPSLGMAGRSGRDLLPVDPAQLIPLPEGSELFTLPGRRAWGWDAKAGRLEPLDQGPQGEPVTAVAAFMAPAHTQHLLAAFTRREGAPPLPLFAYTAVGEWRGRLWAAGRRIDPDPRQDYETFDEAAMRRGLKRRLKAEPGNRLLAHLADCALVNCCPAAKNLFLGRYEAPLPTSPACNSSCLGCLSFQPKKAGFPATQARIRFTPRPEEVAAVAVPHLRTAPRPVVSFGQGCEGEPLMNGALLEASIRAIREATPRGTINCNTNGSRPAVVRRLMRAGLDAIRVSMNAATPAWYEAYYRPRGYRFGDLKASLKAVVRGGGKASINYFVFPGVSDREAEVAALIRLVRETGLHLIQWRNLNLDPDLYLATLGDLDRAGRALGIPALFAALRREFPALRHGYYNPPWRGV